MKKLLSLLGLLGITMPIVLYSMMNRSARQLSDTSSAARTERYTPYFAEYEGYQPLTDFYQSRDNPYKRVPVNHYDYNITSFHETEFGAGLPYGGLSKEEWEGYSMPLVSKKNDSSRQKECFLL